MVSRKKTSIKKIDVATKESVAATAAPMYPCPGTSSILNTIVNTKPREEAKTLI